MAWLRTLRRRIKALIRYFKQEDLHLRGLAIGFNSFIDREKDVHILMLDFDNVGLTEVMDSVGELQDFWKLADADVYKTRKGYHVFFWFDHMPYSRVRLLLSYARGVDPMYRYISRFYNYKTIRVAGKYVQHDIRFMTRVRGVREPSRHEKELGAVKQLEYMELAKSHEMLEPKMLYE